MAKDKQKKKPAKPPGSGKPGGKAAGSAAAGSRRAKMAKAARSAGKKAAGLAANPLVAEVVAAILVSAAAALKSPKKARAMAAAAADDLESMGKEAAGRGGALWQLALDVARRSVDSLDGESARTDKPKAKKKAKKQ